jgi:hypothetical protein
MTGAMRGDLRIATRLAWHLPTFLQQPLGVAQARAILARRLEEREEGFLALLRDGVWGRGPGAYQTLLRHAGCDYGDLERLVRQDGVDGALQRLLRHGVYLTVDEYKGRRPVVRGSLTFSVSPDEFANQLAARHVPMTTSGSRGRGRPLLMDLACIREHGVNVCLTLEAWGGNDWVKTVWEVPGGAALYRLLKLSSFGSPVARWFTHVDPGAPGLSPRYRWSSRLLRWTSVVAGVPLPRPETAPLDDPLPVVRWLAEVVRSGRTPWVRTFPSSAVLACRAALDAGIDLTGAHFTVSGEPVSGPRLQAIRQSGAAVTPRYGTVETGSIGYGCLAPEASDDVHLFHDLHAIVQPEGDRGLFLTSLYRATPIVMLNLSQGDQATLRHRSCGCPLESLGWTTHLHSIGSHEKLTAAGMTFHDTEVIRVLEEVLPAHFGGGPTDYQLVEEETRTGEPSVRLIVHPAVGPLEPATVAERFLAAIGAGAGAERIMATVWRDAGLLRVERRTPFTAASGKILHLHVAPPSRMVPPGLPPHPQGGPP